jgi:hypothetical protein
MKTIKTLIYASAAALLFATACQKDDTQPATISGITFYHPSKMNADSLVTEAKAGRVLTVKVNTNADMCTLWPAGDRLTVKSMVTPTADSIDVYGNPVLVRSDDFKDYGLLFARGKLMTGSKSSGYSFKYTYPNPGTYKVVIIATVHGNSSADFKNNIIEQTLVVK